MSGVLSTVDARTQLVGQNRLELLMFNLGGNQSYAINVFKVQEVVRIPPLTIIPDSHPVVVGVTHLRGITIPVIDLRGAIGMRPHEVTEDTTIIVTEYNRTVQAFMVSGVERIINMNWEDIMPAPQGAGKSHYLTAITKVEEKIVEIIDVEKVLAEISPYNTEISEELLETELLEKLHGQKVLVVDDSNIAHQQIEDTLSSIGITSIHKMNGSLGLEYLKEMVAEGKDPNKELFMIVTDAEMPVMDGYMLTTEIRMDPALKDMYVILHTSLSGSFNESMVKKVGCDGFLSKFQPDGLAKTVLERARDVFK